MSSDRCTGTLPNPARSTHYQRSVHGSFAAHTLCDKINIRWEVIHYQCHLDRALLSTVQANFICVNLYNEVFQVYLSTSSRRTAHISIPVDQTIRTGIRYSRTSSLHNALAIS